MDDTIKFIERLWRGGNLGVFYHQLQGNKFPTSHWGGVETLPDIEDMINKLPKSTTDWFFAVNPLKEIPPTSKKGGTDISYIGSQKEYVQHANCFFLDFDNCTALPPLPLEPSAIVRSSENGLHVYFFLKEPFADSEKYYHMLSGFADSIEGADFAAATIERKLRVPTTNNCKPSYKKLYPNGYKIKIEKLDLSIEYSIAEFEQYEESGKRLRSRSPSVMDESTSLEGFKLEDFDSGFLQEYKQKITNDVNLKLRYSSTKRADLFGQAQLLGANVNIGLLSAEDAWDICVEALKKNPEPVKDWNIALEAFREGLAEVAGQKPIGFESAYGQWIINNLDFEEVDGEGKITARKSEKITAPYVDNFSDFEFYCHGRWVKQLEPFDYDKYNYVRWWQSIEDDEVDGESIRKSTPPPIWKAKIKRLPNSLRMGGVDYRVINGKLAVWHGSSPEDFIPVFNTRINPMIEPTKDFRNFLIALLGTEEQANQFIKALGNVLFSEHPIILGLGNNDTHHHGTDLHGTLLYIFGGSQTTGAINKTDKSFGFENDYSEQSYRNLQFCRVVDTGSIVSLNKPNYIQIVSGRIFDGVDNDRISGRKRYNNAQMYPKASIVFNTHKNEIKQLDGRLKQYLTYFPIGDGDSLGVSPEQATKILRSHAFAHWLVYHALREKDYFGKLHHAPRVQTDEDRATEIFRDWYRIGEQRTDSPKFAKERVHNKDIVVFLTEAGFREYTSGEIKKMITDVYTGEIKETKSDRKGAYYPHLRKRFIPENIT